MLNFCLYKPCAMCLSGLHFHTCFVSEPNCNCCLSNKYAYMQLRSPEVTRVNLHLIDHFPFQHVSKTNSTTKRFLCRTPKGCLLLPPAGFLKNSRTNTCIAFQHSETFQPVMNRKTDGQTLLTTYGQPNSTHSLCLSSYPNL